MSPSIHHPYHSSEQLNFEVCTPQSYIANAESNHISQGRDVRNLLNVLHTFIPPPTGFLPEFRNPCWYAYMSFQNSVHKLIRNAPDLTDKEASLALSAVLLSEEQRLTCLPKVYFIGFPKSGSTQLFRMLIKHPEIVPGVSKEPHWWARYPFNVRFPHNILAIMQYLMSYAKASVYISLYPKMMTIDASQSTVWDTRGMDDLCMMPSLISSVVPDAKYMVIMREPASRLYSDFLYQKQLYGSLKDNNETDVQENLAAVPMVFHEHVLRRIKAFNACMETYPLDVCTHHASMGTSKLDSDKIHSNARLGISLYYVHIAKWLKVIPREQFLFMRTEDLATCPYSLLQRVWKFLELPSQSPFALADVLFEHSNRNQLNSTQMLPETRKLLSEFFQPFNEQLAILLHSDRFLWSDVTSD